MVDIIRFALGFNNPHRDRRIRKVAFIKMKDCFLCDNVQNLRHGISFSVALYLLLSRVIGRTRLNFIDLEFDFCEALF